MLIDAAESYLGISRNHIYYWVHKLGMVTQKVKIGKNWVTDLSEDQVKTIKSNINYKIVDAQRERKDNPAPVLVTKPKKTLEEMKALHPLVTDIRWLRTEVFPNVKIDDIDTLDS